MNTVYLKFKKNKVFLDLLYHANTPYLTDTCVMALMKIPALSFLFKIKADSWTMILENVQFNSIYFPGTSMNTGGGKINKELQIMDVSYFCVYDNIKSLNNVVVISNPCDRLRMVFMFEPFFLILRQKIIRKKLICKKNI